MKTSPRFSGAKSRAGQLSPAMLVLLGAGAGLTFAAVGASLTEQMATVRDQTQCLLGGSAEEVSRCGVFTAPADVAMFTESTARKRSASDSRLSGRTTGPDWFFRVAGERAPDQGRTAPLPAPPGFRKVAFDDPRRCANTSMSGIQVSNPMLREQGQAIPELGEAICHAARSAGKPDVLDEAEANALISEISSRADRLNQPGIRQEILSAVRAHSYATRREGIIRWLVNRATTDPSGQVLTQLLFYAALPSRTENLTLMDAIQLSNPTQDDEAGRLLTAIASRQPARSRKYTSALNQALAGNYTPEYRMYLKAYGNDTHLMLVPRVVELVKRHKVAPPRGPGLAEQYAARQERIEKELTVYLEHYLGPEEKDQAGYCQFMGMDGVNLQFCTELEERRRRQR